MKVLLDALLQPQVALKIDRAMTLAVEVAEYSQAWLRDNPPSVRETLYDWGSEFHIVSQEGPGPEIGIKLSECIHHARTVLDHMVWDLVERGGESPRYQAFPVCKSPSEFSKKLGRELLHVPASAVDLIRTVQPFSINADNPRLAHLWVLHKISNTDKHHFLQPLSPMLAPQETQRTWDATSSVPIRSAEWWDYTSRLLTRDIPMVDIHYDVTSERPQIEIVPGDDPWDLVVSSLANDKGDQADDPAVFLRMSWLPKVVDNVARICINLSEPAMRHAGHVRSGWE